ncbi:MAG TPA: carboxypeptidase regulatory-like domain-containing protein [Candidatus Acidoferrales bacterium]|nr:carboxypeptidase regulatory-like domain-containing protein [Candidatus Acidoferrales bacterium]
MKAMIGSLVALLFLSASLRAQNVSVASISGAVKDHTGAVLPGVTVTVTRTDTGMRRDVLTDENGFYTIPNLPVGPYTLQFSLQGFNSFTQTGITLEVNSNPTINAELQVGTVSQHVEVQANAPLVETQSTGVGQVIENQRVLALPLNGRQATQLILLSAASLPAPPAAFQSPRNYPTLTVSVAGGSAAGLFFVLDGGDHNDVLNNLNLPIPFPDALEEFKVETSAVSARYGYHATGVVNLVTMSGGNTIHGDLFEFVRNGLFNSRNPYALSRDTLKRNQFGGTIGGRIVRNKLFYFAGYQGTITRSDPTTTIAFVPSQAMLQGNFTEAASASCNGGKAVTLGAPFVNNTVDPAKFSSVALAYEKYLPVSSNPCGKYQYGVPSPNSEQQVLGRLDYQWSNRNTMFWRYFFARYNIPYFYNGDALTTGIAGQLNAAQSFVYGDTYAFSPTLNNSVRLTINRTRNDRIPVPFHSPTEFGVAITDLTPAYSALIVNNSFNVGGSLANLGHWNSTFGQVADDVDRLIGSHELSFGVSYFHAILNAFGNQFSNGQFTFSGQNTGLPLADFLIGLPSNYTQGRAQLENERMNHVALYIQDGWQANRRLRLNYGLRWEPFFPMTEGHRHVEAFSLPAFEQGVVSSVYTNAPAGLSFPGDPGFPDDATTSRKFNEFAPRIGIVLDPTGQGTQVIRAGYGIFYDLPSMYYNVRTSSGPPWGNTTGVNNSSFANPWQTFAGGDPFQKPLTPNAPFPQEAVYITYPLHSSPPYVQQWNLTYQRQFSANWAVTLGYLGNKTTHLWLTQEIDPAVYMPGKSTRTNTNQRRVLYLMNPTQGVYYSNLAKLDDGGNADYNAALLTVEKRFSQGFSMFSNYTWSHCLNDGEDFEALGVLLSYQNPANRKADWGACASDRRHSLNVSAVMNTPAFHSPWLRRVGTGWQLSVIAQVESGDTFTVTNGGLDNALTGTSNQRPNVIGSPNLSSTGRTLNAWFNTDTFMPNGPGQYGNAGKGIIRGPGQFVMNAALVRRFSVRENQRVECRVEAFNTLNHIQPNDPNSTFGSPLFGKVTTAGDPRIMQFALKYIF